MSTGAHLSNIPTVLSAGLLGFFGYGVSLVLFVLALRHLGTARTGAYFSTAPFMGAALAIVLLHEPITLPLMAVAVLTGLGVLPYLAGCGTASCRATWVYVGELRG